MATRKKYVTDKAEPPMAAMIDVVFLLLIFFILTFKETKVEAHLAINMPSPDAPPSDEEPPELFEIWVLHNRYLMQGRSKQVWDLDKIEATLINVVASDPNQAVMIKVQQKAHEGKLVDLLDRCAKVGLTNLNVLTLKEGFDDDPADR